MASEDEFYCDDCGTKCLNRDGYHINSLIQDITSANVGESASLCEECYNKQIRNNLNLII